MIQTADVTYTLPMCCAVGSLHSAIPVTMPMPQVGLSIDSIVRYGTEVLANRRARYADDAKYHQHDIERLLSGTIFSDPDQRIECLMEVVRAAFASGMHGDWRTMTEAQRWDRIREMRHWAHQHRIPVQEMAAH